MFATTQRFTLICAYLYWALGAVSLIRLVYTGSTHWRRHLRPEDVAFASTVMRANRRYLLICALLTCAFAFVFMSICDTALSISSNSFALFAASTLVGAASFIVTILRPVRRPARMNILCGVICFLVAVFVWAL